MPYCTAHRTVRAHIIDLEVLRIELRTTRRANRSHRPGDGATSARVAATQGRTTRNA